MSTDPKTDPTSLGAILVSMGTITQEELDMAVEMQERSSIERQLGNQLVVLDVCSNEQIDIALAAQEKMRKNPHEHAVAVADIALARKKRVNGERQKLQESGERVIRKASTGTKHHAITPAMLANPADAK